MPLRELVIGDRAGEAGKMRFVLMLEKYKAQTAGGLAQTPQTHRGVSLWKLKCF